ncbi:MAG: ATP synthase F0 subunit B [Candidatus Omnitrophica bacterium]|nr:ATP synthase F0 subunit B [Candidatus Omnitrophota bacterium]MDD5027821.1 ATP synthase F0 subunit B [Candidatus Omnitrophota bacterium]MDD5662133.1 ATP synthase F0 subunit B [Candidatus Omnitrophota bacterium]
MELLKLLSTNEIVAQILGFLILLVLLRAFAWRSILGLLDKRKERIALEFKKIEEAKADIEKLRLEYAAKIASIDETAQLKVHEALNQAKLILEDSRKNGYLQAQAIIDNAKQSVKYELAKAKDELKNEIIDLTLKATEDLIQEKFTGEGDRKLVEDFLKGVDKL